MRPKIVIAVVTLGALALAALFCVRQTSNASAKNSQPQPISAIAPQSNAISAVAVTQAVEQTAVPAKKRVQAEARQTTSSEDAHKDYVEQRSSQLMELAMTDDPASLETILSELTNRDPEIRKAALEAAIQFGSRDAIPKLADAASQTDDPNEKAAIADAIEFLKLPSWTEVKAQSAKPLANNPPAETKPAHKGAWGKRVLAVPPGNQ